MKTVMVTFDAVMRYPAHCDGIKSPLVSFQLLLSVFVTIPERHAAVRGATNVRFTLIDFEREVIAPLNRSARKESSHCIDVDHLVSTDLMRLVWATMKNLGRQGLHPITGANSSSEKETSYYASTVFKLLSCISSNRSIWKNPWNPRFSESQSSLLSAMLNKQHC
jgi:hypothetical protein